MRQFDGVEVVGQVALIAACPGGAGIEIGIAAQAQPERPSRGDLRRAEEFKLAIGRVLEVEPLPVDLDLEPAVRPREGGGDEALDHNPGYRPLVAKAERDFGGRATVE